MMTSIRKKEKSRTTTKMKNKESKLQPLGEDKGSVTKVRILRSPVVGTEWVTEELSVRRQMILQCQDPGTIMGLERDPFWTQHVQVLPQVAVTTVPSRLWRTCTELEVDVEMITGTTIAKGIVSMTSCHRTPVYTYQIQQDVSFSCDFQVLIFVFNIVVTCLTCQLSCMCIPHMCFAHCFSRSWITVV